MAAARCDHVTATIAHRRCEDCADERLNDVVDVDEIADIGAVAIEGQWLALNSALHHNIENASVGVDRSAAITVDIRQPKAARPNGTASCAFAQNCFSAEVMPIIDG